MYGNSSSVGSLMCSRYGSSTGSRTEAIMLVAADCSNSIAAASTRSVGMVGVGFSQLFTNMGSLSLLVN